MHQISNVLFRTPSWCKCEVSNPINSTQCHHKMYIGETEHNWGPWAIMLILQISMKRNVPHPISLSVICRSFLNWDQKFASAIYLKVKLSNLKYGHRSQYSLQFSVYFPKVINCEFIINLCNVRNKILM